MSKVELLKYIYKHRKLFLSHRFIILSFSLLVACVWLLVIAFDWLLWFGFDLKYNLVSLPLSVYALWLAMLSLSAMFACVSLPVERKLLSYLEQALSDLRVFDAERLIQRTRRLPYLLPTTKIELGGLEASFNKSQGEFGKAFDGLQQLKSLPLLAKERVNIDLDLINLFFTSGNFKEAQELLEQLKKYELSDTQHYKCVRNQVELHLARSEFQAAKDLLEKHLLEPDLSASAKVSLQHTLGVAETHLKNYVGALTAYRQAWEIQKTFKSSFGQAEITIENLVLTYAKQGQTEQIQPLLNELDALANSDNAEHLLALHNIQINLARQLGDKKELLVAYKSADENILPKLSGESRFFYLINGLRMHWNDGVEFSKVLKTTQKVMLNRPDLSPLKTLRCIKEVTGTVKQVIDKVGPRSDLMTFYSWLILEFKRLEPEIDRLLDNTPTSLPSPKNELIGFKIDIIKHSFMYESPSKIHFERIFELLSEKRSLWQGMHNPVDQLNELMIILDEYIAFKHQLEGTDFQHVFETTFCRLATDTLDEAEQILSRNLNNLAYTDKLIGLAFACCQLNTKKPQAKKWLETFEQSKQSLNHMAVWLREQHQQTKVWVNEVSIPQS